MLALSSCVTVNEATTCAALPRLINGGGCSHLISDATFLLSRTELEDLIDAHPTERKCVPKGDLPVCADDQTRGAQVTIPPRGASIIMLDSQWGEMATELETACRELGSYCNYAQVSGLVTRMRSMQRKAAQ